MKDLIKNIPSLPWVYQFFDKNKNILYVWKSINLKSRVSSYFNPKNKLNFWKKKMISQIHDIKTIITSNEVEALLLETNLIKKFKPKYNILMKDDKSHTYIKITDEFIPKIIKTRQKIQNWIYFGPFIKTNYVNVLLNFLKKHFWYRSCNIKFEKQKDKIILKNIQNQKIPCMDYYIKRCSWPCLKEEKNIKSYIENIENIKKVLNWNTNSLINYLKEKMQKKAQNLEFEEANKIKETIFWIQMLNENQIISNNIKEPSDIINFVEKYEKIYLSIIQVRNSKIIWIKNFEITDNLKDTKEAIISFIEQYYNEKSNNKINLILPYDIWLKQNILDALWINKIEIPKIWEKQELLKMAYKNAFEYWYKTHLNSLSVKRRTKKDRKDLLDLLWYKQINNQIIFECNDISHISWNYTVASRSVFINGKKAPSKYKKYKIKTLEKWIIDDFWSLKEVIQRRLDEIIKTQTVPDLIIIDWWKWQLSSAQNIVNQKIKDYENDETITSLLKKIQLISIAKKEEILYKPDSKEDIIIEKESMMLKIIQQLRDEAHRFAITFNRNSRIKWMKKNLLEELPWFWPKTRQKLLRHYKRIENIKNDEFLQKTLTSSQIETLKEYMIL